MIEKWSQYCVPYTADSFAVYDFRFKNLITKYMILKNYNGAEYKSDIDERILQQFFTQLSSKSLCVVTFLIAQKKDSELYLLLRNS